MERAIVLGMKTLFAPFAIIVFLALSASLGCSKPKAPQLTPKEAVVTSVDVLGFEMRVKMDVYNENDFPLTVRDVAAHVVLNGAQDLGTMKVVEPITLAANTHTLVDVPMTVRWKGALGFASLAQATRPVPYTVDGTANIGGDRLNLQLPFRLEGRITPEQVKEAVTRSLEKLPGLGLPSLVPSP